MRSARSALSALAADIGALASHQSDVQLAAQLNALRDRAARIEDQLRQLESELPAASPAPTKAWQQVRAGSSSGSRSASPALSLRYGSRSSSLSSVGARPSAGSLISQRMAVAEINGEARSPNPEDWRSRWCVLRANALEVYTDETEGTSLISMPLSAATVSIPDLVGESGEAVFCIERWAAQLGANDVDIVEQRHAVWCAVHKRDDMRDWLHCIQRAKRELCTNATLQASSPALAVEEEESPFTSLVSQLLVPPPTEPPPPPPSTSPRANERQLEQRSVPLPASKRAISPAPASGGSMIAMPSKSPPLPPPFASVSLAISAPLPVVSPTDLLNSPPNSPPSTSPPTPSSLLSVSPRHGSFDSGMQGSLSPSSYSTSVSSVAAAVSAGSANAAPNNTAPVSEVQSGELPAGPLALRLFQRNNRKALSVENPRVESPSKTNKREPTGLWQRIVKREGTNDVVLVRTSPPPEASFSSLGEINSTPQTESERRERQVRAVITELVTTETEHVWSLQLAVKHYLRGVSDLIRHDDLKWLIGPVERLMMMENEFYAKLQGLTEANEVAEVFTSSSEALRAAYVPYCVHYDEATALLRQFRQRAEVGKRLAELQRSPECRQLDLEDLLIKPPQRLCRYPLLLKELARALPPDSPAVLQVEKAVQVMEELLRAANETKRQSETIHLLVQLKELIHWPPNLDFEVLPTRQLLRRAAFARILVGKETTPFRGSLLLFSDCLLVVEQRKSGRAREDHARELLFLCDCAVLDVAKSNVFTVVRSILPGGRVVVTTASKEEKDDWINILTAQVTALTAPMSPRQER